MYTIFYNLKLDPFRLTPDPQFFYASHTHQRGLSYLRYALHQREGFVVITGAPGTGKTELMLNLINGIPKDKIILSKIVTANLHADDLLELVAASYIKPEKGLGKGLLLKKLEDYFSNQARVGKQILLLIDEAHNLSTRALIELSMLSNFQLDTHPVLQCFLLGQEPLEQKLAQPELAHLKQRVIASSHLHQLNLQETHDYIKHRLHIAGWCGDPQISESSYPLIHQFTSGVPRRINTLCSRLLLEAFLEETHLIDIALVIKIIDELQEDDTSPPVSVPQLSLALDFSTDSVNEPIQPIALETEQIQQVPKADSRIKENILNETSSGKVIDVEQFAPVKSGQPEPQSCSVIEMPRFGSDISPQGSVLMASLPNTMGKLSSDTDTVTQTGVRPENVHMLFDQPASSINTEDDLVIALPAEETTEYDYDIIPEEQVPVFIDAESRDHHRLLYETGDKDGYNQDSPVQQFQTLLAQFRISRMGIFFSVIILVVLWWFVYGSDNAYVIQSLQMISSLIG